MVQTLHLEMFVGLKLSLKMILSKVTICCTSYVFYKWESLFFLTRYLFFIISF